MGLLVPLRGFAEEAGGDAEIDTFNQVAKGGNYIGSM
jgi:hypothetical protein